MMMPITMPKTTPNMLHLNIEDDIIKVWYPEGSLSKSYGFITDYYRDYVEIYDIEKKIYVIVHWTLLDFE